MHLFDLHCDSAYRMKKEGLTPVSDALHVNAHTVTAFDEVAQIFAFWCDKALDDEAAYRSFFETLSYFKAYKHLYGNRVKAILSVEDGRLLCECLDRLDTLKRHGVRLLTPFWGAENCLGCGHRTKKDTGLSAFGEAAVLRCFERQILCDVSHASQKSTEDILSLAKGKAPVVATHSNFSSIFPHTRNLTDEQAIAIHKSGGLIGLSMVAPHLAGQNASLDDFARHWFFACSLGIEESLCLGCDFDGTDELPQGIENQASLLKMADFLLKEGVSKKRIDALFWGNATRFFENYFA
ncbi:MAG: dipeptidase [Clostridia bacterium]|nr:dipeptidase [Clostridia bacterium]